ncbi:MAG: hypothetical protein NT154_03990 [Verrucomicrobia bacterium]|nr:hypothetical protein [Verrucomicrobiota bacterium]
MSFLISARNLLVCGFLALAAPAVVLGQTNYLPIGVEYAIGGSLPGDQASPQLGLKVSGGYLVWEDNNTDGDGLGISALRLDSSFSGSLGPSFRVNNIGVEDQEHPQVSLLHDGGAVFVWQGGAQGYQHIYARVRSSSNEWATADVQVNSFTNNYQVDPVVTTLANGNVAVAWASFNQVASTSMQDVYAQVLSPTGDKLTSELQVNQLVTSYNQRNPAIAALSDGRFVVVWLSEQQTSSEANGNTVAINGTASVDVYARIFTAAGVPSGGECLLNTSANTCSSPQVSAGAGGTFMVVWAEKERMATTNGWDILARAFSNTGVGGIARVVNTMRFGDQYLPRISWDGSDYLAVWTSLGQDGSQEGVFGQFLHDDGSPDRGEFQVNTTWISQQQQPVVASDGLGRFLAVWTSFVGIANGFDLYAQRYVNVSAPLPAIGAPFVQIPFVVSNGFYQPLIQVSWPVPADQSVDHFDVYVDGALVTSVATNLWIMTAGKGLAVSTSYSFQVDYVTTSGRRSPLSAATVGTTWDKDIYGNLLPVEWMAQNWGYGHLWPNPNDQVTPGGPTVLDVFRTGANPFDPTTWLRAAMSVDTMGTNLTWAAQPGLFYQVQISTNFGSWMNVGTPQLATNTVGINPIDFSNAKAAYYRVIWLH